MSDEDYTLSILNSNVYYEKLDNAPDYSIYEDDAFWKTHIMKTCIKDTKMFDAILKAFHYVAYFKNEGDTFFKERWNFLYFWVGSKAIANTVKGCPFENVISVLKHVKEHIHKIPYDYDIEKIDSSHFKYLKVVYDIFRNYESIELNIGGHTSNCTKEYKEYVDRSFGVYEQVKDVCESKGTEEYCKLFKYIVGKHNNKVLKKLTCNGTMPSFTVEQYKKSLLDDSDQDVELKGQMQSQPYAMKIQAGEASSSLHSDNIMPTFFPILGIFSTLFLLYNFSPFRSWLDNNISEKEIIRHPLYEEGDEFFESEYESPDKNTEYNRHDVSYHSMINT
ncbi:Plasmodium vivax Vir protein, putative [Plasmodium ovale]|uniref:Plasmodium vivax Vir protein, putative n=1 Tax=Plasmodium ovale TaxID=36330 RepID=A0A1C3KJ29_PLAOA|nr:Plasmodium vivax Vir protein, putative [Plasmodium ovale]